MKKITKKMKGKKVLSLVLAAIMIATTFNIALPMLKLDANAAGSITTSDGETVTQTPVVSDSASAYDIYEAKYLNGAGRSTGIVIPGLSSNENYVIQGMTYYPAKDWMLVTAYHNVADGETAKSSKVFALDAATGNFVAMFDFENVDGTVNTDHGGGIAVSEHNLYYACGDKDQKIAYAPLSEFDVEENTHKTVKLLDSINLYELGDAYTAYVCYDEGILWAGNFYDPGASILGVANVAADYNKTVNGTYNSMVFGYRLVGESSTEEWDYLKGKFANLLSVATESGTATSNDANFNWTAYKNAGSVNVKGTITAPSAYVGEFTASNVCSFTLTEGVNYTVEFTSNNNASDLYMWSPAGTHCNVKQSTQTTITPLENGRYHYKMNFTAGLKPNGADSSWPTTQSTDSTYTGNYTLRFDQDAIQAGESREFEITNIKISQTNTYDSDVRVYNEGSAGSPTYAVALSNNIKDVQYAVVDNGKLYLSRSYGSGAGNSVTFGFGETSLLTIADIDLSVTGSKTTDIKTASGTKTINVYEISDYDNYDMMPMSEGLCVIEDKIYATFESASYKYITGNDGLTGIGNCEKQVDVIWEIDPYALMEQEIPEEENSIYYEKVRSLSDIKDGEEYIIIHQSPEEDPVTQNKILYAINADGGLKGHNLSKSSVTTPVGYDAMVSHPITEYTIIPAGEKDSVGEVSETDRLYLENKEKDDVDSVRWTLNKTGEKRYSIKTTESYFANCNSLYFDKTKIGMAPSNANYLNAMAIQECGNGNGGFWLSNAETYYLWCNDGLSENYNKKITSFYIENGATIAAYSGVDEIDGTFHCDALNTTNIIGQKIEDDNDRVFYIYKRVIDDAASTYESRVYTDLDAELQADGTYTIDLETYAISPNHYKYVGERPTDYVLVMDTSSSMDTEGSTGIKEFSGSLSVASLSKEADTSDDNGVGINGYGFSNPDEQIYLKHTDGNYYKVFMAVYTTEKGFLKIRQKYYAYYIADDGLYYCIEDHKVNSTGRTQEEWKAWVDSGENESDYSTKTSNGTRRKEDVYQGMHYRFDDVNSTYNGDHTRIQTLKNSAKSLIDGIAAQNPGNRIALVQYGADASTGFITTSGNISTTDYANAFWATGTADQLKTKVDSLSTSTQTSNDGIEMLHAKNLMLNGGGEYGPKGNKNIAIILISDGIPGADNDNTNVTVAANNNIGYALTAKDNGAFIYTVLVGDASVSNFNHKTYLAAVSSEYQAASNITTLGGQSVDGIDYTPNLSTSTINTFVNFGEITTKQVELNAAVALDNLDDDAVIRQELSESFRFDEASYEAELIEGNFDAIGRFSFDEEGAKDAIKEGVVITPVDGTRCLTITGYNYASEYIGRHKSGRKLRVRITGVLPKEGATIQNTPITNTDTTAIYKSVEDMNKTTEENDLAFKKLPTNYFNIPKYTYVLDYGLQLLDTDVNGTLKAVSAGLTKQDVDNYIRESENGLVAIQDGDQNLLYHTTPTNDTDSGYVLIQRPEGNYDWFEIEVVPASNVYFEETEMKVKDSGATKKAAWSDPFKATNETRGLPTEDDVDGFENAYAVQSEYSNGTTRTVTVNSTTRNSQTQTFDFTGTGIDIVSRCSATTGMMLITIKNKTTGARVKSALVDTYCEAGTFNQTPIFSWSGDYGTYTVEIGAMYLTSAGALKANSTTKNFKKSNIIDTGLEMNASDSFDTDVLQAMLDEADVEDVSAKDVELVWFDDNSIFNGGTGVAPTKNGSRADGTGTVNLENYIDGFRVYNPINPAAAEKPDYKETEKNATYVNVSKNLSELCSDGSNFGNIAYITGNLADGESLNFAKYKEVGPKDELYLKPGTAISFKVDRAANERVMLGLRAVNGVTDVTVNNIKVKAESGIKSSTEMYYDITDCGVAEGTDITFTVTNSGTGILAINHIKFSGGDAQNTTVSVTGARSMARSNDTSAVETSKFLPITQEDLVAIESVMKEETIPAMVKNGVIVPIVEEEEDVSGDNTNPGDDNINDDTNNDNGNTDTDNETDDSFDIFSIIKALIAFIKEILFNSVGNKSLL